MVETAAAAVMTTMMTTTIQTSPRQRAITPYFLVSAEAFCAPG